MTAGRTTSAARRLGITGALTIALVLRVFAIAAAHATLISSDPAAGSTVAWMPARLRLVFSEPIEPGLAKVSLVTRDGRTLILPTLGDPHDVHAIIADAAQATAIGHGEVRVAWHIVSADGHPVGGNFVFSVGSSDTARHAPSLTPTPPPANAEVSVWGPAIAGAPLIPALLRGIGIGCLLALGGLLSFIALASTPAVRATRVALGLSVAIPLFLGAHLVAWLINASPDHHLDAAWLASSLASTVGRVEIWRTGLSLLPLWALGLACRPRLALVLTVPALLLSAAVGHSAAIHPQWAVPFKVLHLGALAMWLGGLLWIVLRDHEGQTSAVTEIKRVSEIALWAVVVVTASGIVQTLMLIPSVSGLASPYGAIVLAKVAGLAVLVAFGAYHRMRFIPAIVSGREAATSMLRSWVARELFVFCIVILLGGFLAYLSPPIRAAADASTPSSETAP